MGLTQPEEQRLARLEKYIAVVENAYKNMVQSISSGETEGFSEEQIKFYLSSLPNQIAESALFLAKIERAAQYALVDVETIQAELWKKYNAQKEVLGLSNAKDREAYTKTDPDLIRAKQQLLEWKYRAKQMQIICDRYDNLFTSVRKLANLLGPYNQAQDLYAKYNSE